MNPPIQIQTLTIRDGETGDVLCDHAWDERDDEEHCVEIPARVLQCQAVSRELTFHSTKQLDDLRIVQRVMMEQQPPPSHEGARPRWTCLEEWVFAFGFVIPGSTNAWQSVVYADMEEDAGTRMALRRAELVIESNFYDGKAFLCKTSVRVRYV